MCQSIGAARDAEGLSIFPCFKPVEDYHLHKYGSRYGNVFMDIVVNGGGFVLAFALHAEGWNQIERPTTTV